MNELEKFLSHLESLSNAAQKDNQAANTNNPYLAVISSGLNDLRKRLNNVQLTIEIPNLMACLPEAVAAAEQPQQTKKTVQSQAQIDLLKQKLEEEQMFADLKQKRIEAETGAQVKSVAVEDSPATTAENASKELVGQNENDLADNQQEPALPSLVPITNRETVSQIIVDLQTQIQTAAPTSKEGFDELISKNKVASGTMIAYCKHFALSLSEKPTKKECGEVIWQYYLNETAKENANE